MNEQIGRQERCCKQVYEQDVDATLLRKKQSAVSHSNQKLITVSASILKAEFEKLHTLWLADQVFNLVKDQPNADEALKSVSKTIKKK